MAVMVLIETNGDLSACKRCANNLDKWTPYVRLYSGLELKALEIPYYVAVIIVVDSRSHYSILVHFLYFMLSKSSQAIL